MAQAHNFGIIGTNGKAIEGVTLTTFSDSSTYGAAKELAGKDLGLGEVPTDKAIEKTLDGMMMARARRTLDKETLVFPKN